MNFNLNSAFLQSAITFVLRRALTGLGATGAAISDNWYTETAGIILAAGNELVQWWLAYRAEKRKRGEA